MIRLENNAYGYFQLEFDNNGLMTLIQYVKNIYNSDSVDIIHDNVEKKFKLIVLTEYKNKQEMRINEKKIEIEIPDDRIVGFSLFLEDWIIKKNLNKLNFLHRYFREEWIHIYGVYITKEYVEYCKEMIVTYNRRD